MDKEQLYNKYKHDSELLSDKYNDKLEKLQSQRNINISHRNNLINKYKNDHLTELVKLYKTFKNNINNTSL
jgi:hypothetical protein